MVPPSASQAAEWDPNDVQGTVRVILPLRELYIQLHNQLGPDARTVLSMLLDCVLQSYDFGQDAWWRLKALLKNKDLDTEHTRLLLAKSHADLVGLLQEYLPTWDLDSAHRTTEHSLIHKCDLSLVFTPEWPSRKPHVAPTHAPCEGSHLHFLRTRSLPYALWTTAPAGRES